MSSTENQQKTLAQQKSDSELKETFGPDFDIETDCPSCGCDRGKHDVSARNRLIPCESDGEWDDEDMAAFHMERGPPFDEITQEMIQKYRAAEPPAPKKKRKLIIKRRASKKRITPCEPRCQPSPKIGGSWWKDLGYNSACGCAKLANFSAHNPDISITRQGKVFNIRHTAETFDEEFQNQDPFKDLPTDDEMMAAMMRVEQFGLCGSIIAAFEEALKIEKTQKH